MSVGMVIANYNREHLLRLSLTSLRQQTVFQDLDVLAVNNGDNCDAFEKTCTEFGIRHIHLPRTDDLHSWARCINFGVSNLANHDILILSEAEIYYVENDCIEMLINAVQAEPCTLAMPYGIDDLNGKYLESLTVGDELSIPNNFQPMKLLPFLIALRREHFDAIGGCSLEYVGGRGFDDDDLMLRLKTDRNCRIQQIKRNFIHLYHPRLPFPMSQFFRNRKIFINKRSNKLRMYRWF